jgi:hypothetical protein
MSSLRTSDGCLKTWEYQAVLGARGIWLGVRAATRTRPGHENQENPEP